MGSREGATLEYQAKPSVEVRETLFHSNPVYFEPEFKPMTRESVIADVFFPDWVEIAILIFSYFFTEVFETVWFDLRPWSIQLIPYVSLTAFFCYLVRWSYGSPFHFWARVRNLHKLSIAKGRQIVDFKLFGFLTCFILIVIGIVVNHISLFYPVE